MARVHDVRINTLSCFSDDTGSLVAYQEMVDFPVGISRVFVVSSDVGTIRGRHAHRQLTQVLVCTSGSCKVTCDDGESTKELLLKHPSQVLVIPPGIWAEQEYLAEGSVLMVLCDLPYDEEEYIRDYDEFIVFRKEYCQ